MLIYFQVVDNTDLEELHAARDALAERCSQLLADNENDKKQMSELSESNAELKQRLEKAEIFIANLREELKQAGSNQHFLNEARAQTDKLQGENDALKMQLSDAKSDVASLNARNVRLLNTDDINIRLQAELNEKIAEKEKQLEEAKSSADGLAVEKAKLLGMNDWLKRQKKEVKASAKERRALVERLLRDKQAENRRLTALVDDYRRREEGTRAQQIVQPPLTPMCTAPKQSYFQFPPQSRAQPGPKSHGLPAACKSFVYTNGLFIKGSQRSALAMNYICEESRYRQEGRVATNYKETEPSWRTWNNLRASSFYQPGQNSNARGARAVHAKEGYNSYSGIRKTERGN